MHDMLTSSKDAKRFTHLKVGQEVKLKLDPKGELQALRVKQSELETIGLDKTDKGYLSLIHISEPTRHFKRSRMPSSA